MGGKQLIPLLLIIGGVVFIMSAKQNQDPRNIIFEALRIKQRVPKPSPLPTEGVSGPAMQGLQGLGLTGSSYTGDTGVKVTSV